jgi:hypothetical protein
MIEHRRCYPHGDWPQANERVEREALLTRRFAASGDGRPENDTLAMTPF